MGKAITDYVKFLAEARDAVYRLNCDENTANQLRGQEAQEERELEAARKEIADIIEQTVQSRNNEISSSYYSEIQKEQERLKKARARREKAKNKGIKDRIFDETKGLREERRVKNRISEGSCPGLLQILPVLCTLLSKKPERNTGCSGDRVCVLSGAALRGLLYDS